MRSRTQHCHLCLHNTASKTASLPSASHQQTNKRPHFKQGHSKQCRSQQSTCSDGGPDAVCHLCPYRVQGWQVTHKALPGGRACAAAANCAIQLNLQAAAAQQQDSIARQQHNSDSMSTLVREVSPIPAHLARKPLQEGHAECVGARSNSVSSIQGRRANLSFTNVLARSPNRAHLWQALHVATTATAFPICALPGSTRCVCWGPCQQSPSGPQSRPADTCTQMYTHSRGQRVSDCKTVSNYRTLFFCCSRSLLLRSMQASEAGHTGNPWPHAQPGSRLSNGKPLKPQPHAPPTHPLQLPPASTSCHPQSS
jgi:hypothetical protein